MNEEYNIAIRDRQAGVTGLASVGLAFKRALVSQCHPKMLAALFLPFIIALLGAIILLWAFWTPLTQWLNADGVDVNRTPKIADHFRRVGERPAVQRALAEEKRELQSAA